MNIFMVKPNATYEYDWHNPFQDDYERTERYDQCDPMVGLPQGYPNPYFDWNTLYQERE